MTYLATLAQVQRETQNDKPDKVGDHMEALRHVSARLEAMKKIYFEPRVETRYFDALVGQVTPDGRTLLLTDLMLADLTGVTLGDGTVVTLSDVRANPRGETPIRELTLKDGSSWLVYDDAPEQAIAITGVWVWRKEYTREAWRTVTALDGGINANATEIPVDSIANVSPGMLVRVGAEYMRVTDTITVESPAAVKLVVERGINGTTAAAHLDEAAVMRFIPADIIERAALRWAAYLLARQTSFTRVSFDGVATTVYPADAPEEITNTLRDIKTKRMIFGS